jgi:hypothetical protein
MRGVNLDMESLINRDKLIVHAVDGMFNVICGILC